MGNINKINVNNVDYDIHDERIEVTAADKGKFMKANALTGDLEWSEVPAGAMQYLAPEYDAANTYNTGDLVVYEDALYNAKEDNVTGTWDSTKWKSATVEENVKTRIIRIAQYGGTLTGDDLIAAISGNAILKTGDYYFVPFSSDGVFITYFCAQPQDPYNDGTKYWYGYRITKSSGFYEQANISTGLGAYVRANPTLTGTEAELLGLQVGNTKYKAQSLSNTDSITCAYATPTDFTIADSYSSYNRCGAIITFVLAFSITKDNATTTPINIATFSNIPNNIFTKLVPTTVGLNDYLDQIELDGFSDTYANVKAPVNLTKGLTDTITLALDPTNLVVGTKYHFRYFISFLLTDNLTRVDPILDNNSWADINEVFLDGVAANYWSVGDLKNFIGSDGVPRQQRIVDLSGLYGKHGVFEQVALDGSDGSGAKGVVWNSSSNVDSDNAYNDWNISEIRAYLQSTVLLRYPSDLQAILTNTTIQTAKNGKKGITVSTSDKLFLAAEKELSSSASISRSGEIAVLTTWQYYQTHSAAADRIKYKNGDLISAGYWWTRSPASGSSNSVVLISSNGTFASEYAYEAYRVAPAFSL